MKSEKKKVLVCSAFLMVLLIPEFVFGMHIMEGFLPPIWCISWGILTIPFLVWGFHSIKKTVEKNRKTVILLAMAGAFVFLLSSLKIPSVTGSCSHPTGVGLGAIMFGPAAMSVIGLIVLLFQALLLAHGGITTLGANTFSMAVVGPIVAFVTYKLVLKIKLSRSWAVFLAATLGNLMTYVTTSFQLALAFNNNGFFEGLSKFLSVFAVTQIPLAISEGILTVVIFNAISQYNKEELIDLKVISEEV